MIIKQITAPLTDEVINDLKAGDKILISGYIYTARDAAHKRFIEAIEKGQPLPFDVRGQIVYYCGPTPPPPGRVIGSCGPTTSSRMDTYAPKLLELGLKGMIGKGKRAESVKEAIKKYRGVYFGATGGAGALLAKSVLESETIAYDDLGPEAVRKLTVKEMPVFVINDIYGNDLYEEGMTKYRK